MLTRFLILPLVQKPPSPGSAKCRPPTASRRLSLVRGVPKDDLQQVPAAPKTKTADDQTLFSPSVDGSEPQA